MISQLRTVDSASSGIFIWQDTVSSEFSFIVFPTILHRLWSLMLVEPWAQYTILFCKLNLTLVSFEEELQAVPTTDTISPARNRSTHHCIPFFLKKCTCRWIKISRIAEAFNTQMCYFKAGQCLPGVQTFLSTEADNLTCPLEKTPTSLPTEPVLGNWKPIQTFYVNHCLSEMSDI